MSTASKKRPAKTPLTAGWQKRPAKTPLTAGWRSSDRRRRSSDGLRGKKVRDALARIGGKVPDWQRLLDAAHVQQLAKDSLYQLIVQVLTMAQDCEEIVFAPPVQTRPLTPPPCRPAGPFSPASPETAKNCGVLVGDIRQLAVELDTSRWDEEALFGHATRVTRQLRRLAEALASLLPPELQDKLFPGAN